MSEHCKTKEKIFFTAVKMFSERGYKNVSMRDIAEDIGIKAASIYNHFESKAKILEGIYDYFFEKLEKYMPTVDSLLALAETKPPSEVFLMLDYHFPGIEEVMDRIIVIGGTEFLTDDISASFIKKLFVEVPRFYIGALLNKWIETKVIMPIDVDAFLYIYTSMGFNASMRLFSKIPVNVGEWRRAWMVLISLLKKYPE
ncbi:MAG: TetR/AcrR family transcriptional regulator [Clostridiales bacterium]|jgi:AcrR family transcriptional regulator|nr:TetR/AcrR family transcriptional regulator [Clostridiales bacterium]